MSTLSEMASFLKLKSDSASPTPTPKTDKLQTVHIEADTIEEAKAEAISKARALGIPEEEIKKLEEQLDKIDEDFQADQAKRKFGLYNHSAVMGLTSAAQASENLDSMRARHKAQPGLQVSLSAYEVVRGLAAFQSAYMQSMKDGKPDAAKIFEMGMLLMMWASGFCGKDLNPVEIIGRMACLWDGDGPGELTFRPVFDEDYQAVTAAWLDYKEGRTSKEQFKEACAAIRPLKESSNSNFYTGDKCDCEDCKKERGES